MRCDARTSADANSGTSDCGTPLIAVLHQCPYLGSTAQPCVPLENIKKRLVWSTLRGCQEDELTCSEIWVPQTVPSEFHPSLSYLVSQSGDVVIQVDNSDMVLPGNIGCHSKHSRIDSVQCLLILPIKCPYLRPIL